MKPLLHLPLIDRPGRGHLLSIDDLDAEHLDALFARATRLLEQPDAVRRPLARTLASVFLEPSTRTRLSFEAAMLRLGGRVLSVPPLEAMRYGASGESFSDTIRTIAAYADIVVLRTPSHELTALASARCPVPLINGGDGSNEHPTQALTDLFTIRRIFGRLEGLRVVLWGDLAHSRVGHSLFRGLSRFANEIVLVSPPELRLPPEHQHSNPSSPATITALDDVDAALRQADVVYLWGEEPGHPTSRYTTRPASDYVLSPKRLRLVRPDAVILHPFHRGPELPEAVDTTPQARYFEQMHNGMFVRMALLEHLLSVR